MMISSSGRPALWSHRRDGKSLQCLLCPQACLLKPGETGKCGVRRHDWVKGLVTTNDRRVLALAVDPVEKKPLYHWRPGTSILSVGTGGCNMACPYCQNHELVYSDPSLTGEELSPLELRLLLNQKGLKALAFTYNEPLVWYEYVLETARELRDGGYSAVLVTNGQITPGPARALIPLLDAVNVDVKAFSEESYRRLGGHLKATLAFVEALLEQEIHVELTHLVVPGLFAKEEFDAMIRWVASLDRSLPLHLSRCLPRHRWRERPTDKASLVHLAEEAKEELSFVYLGNVGGESKTSCLQCGHDIVVRREYNVVAMELDAEGKCLCCGGQSSIRF
ncbi:MAG: AmmeMemoRadiSam system radical SAM enzyme [Synergistaceae bacterium]|nr:AmmeMemoRadiSam system radical SAM enzyme [Synergistaceae bacterium]